MEPEENLRKKNRAHETVPLKMSQIEFSYPIFSGGEKYSPADTMYFISINLTSCFPQPNPKMENILFSSDGIHQTKRGA